MNPATAVGLLLAGLAIGLHQRTRRGPAMLCAAAMTAIAAAKLADLAGAELAVDRLLFAADLAAQPDGKPNRMAPNTALASLVLGLGLVLAGWPRAAAAARFGQLCAAMVFLIGLFTLVGYALGLDPLRAVGPFIPMALHTGAAFVLASIGLLCLSPDRGIVLLLRDPGPAGSLARTILPLTFLTSFTVGALRLWGQQAGYYGTQGGVALMVVANVFVTGAFLGAGIAALHRSDRLRRDREEALRASEHLNRSMIEASPDCASLLDLEGRVLSVNRAALRAYGLEDDGPLIGRVWGERLAAGDLPRRDAALAVAQAGGIGRLTLSLPGPEGEPHWYESLVTRLCDAEGRPLRLMVLSRDITAQKSIEEQVRWSASHDALTGLPNRAFFQERLEGAIRAGPERRFALLLLDIDDFKQVNDTLGHDAGDALLCTLAGRLKAALRPEDVVARLGGDEFAIILAGAASEAAAAAAARNIFEKLKEPWLYNGRIGDCRVSVGASLYGPHGREGSELLKNADIALYAAKLRDRGRIAIYERQMRSELHRRSSMIGLARTALQDGLIRAFYQPKVDLASGRIAGFEALLRWRHPTRGMQPPSSIAAAFEDLELAAELTDRMLERVLADVRRWMETGLAFGHVAVNASAADFRQGDYAERLLDRLAAASVPPGLMQVEVTETVFLGPGAGYVERALKQLSAAGVRIALDDFGTGYASLSHLKQFPVDIVKIDRSFVADIGLDADNAAIVGAVVNLGRSLGLDVVAEGIETRGQQAYLLSRGCGFGQGFLFGKAAPASRVPALIRARNGEPRPPRLAVARS